MQARPIDSSSRDAYDALASEFGRVFYRRSWAENFGTTLRQVGIFDDHNLLVGGLHYVEERVAGFKFIRNPPFTPVIGPFMRVKSQNPVALLESKRKVLEAVADFFACQRRAIVSVALDYQVADGLAFQWRGFKTSPRYTYRIELNQTKEQIFKNFSQARRNDISKAIRDGLTVERSRDLQSVSKLVQETFIRTSGRLNAEVLQAVLRRYAKPENSFAFIVRQHDRPIAATFIIHDQGTAYYLLGGYDSEHSHHGAGALAVSESIIAASEMGLQIFDFEGSSIPPIERFFRGFGGQLTHHFIVSRAWFPLEVLLKYKKRNLF